MKHSGNNTEGYSIITSLLMIAFLLVLTTNTLNLVMQEMKDGRGRQSHMKAYAGAEGAMELGLLEIKDIGYGVWDDVEDSELLGDSKKIPTISYTYDGRVQSYTGSLDSGETDIIPLFWIDIDGTTQKITDVNFVENTDILQWGVITDQLASISGIGDFNENYNSDVKIFGGGQFSYAPQRIGQLLTGSNTNYLLVLNPSDKVLSYTLSTSQKDDNYFTAPRETLSSSARVGKYSQNIDTTIDNTEFLGALKYAIFSQ